MLSNHSVQLGVDILYNLTCYAPLQQSVRRCSVQSMTCPLTNRPNTQYEGRLCINAVTEFDIFTC